MSDLRTKYNYSTSLSRIQKLKVQAIKECKNVNEILDKLIDEYLDKN